MSMNKVAKTIGLELDLDSLRKAAIQAKNLISNLEGKGTPPKNLISAFDKVEKIFDRLAEKTKEGIFKGSSSEYNSLLRDLDQIGIEFGSIEKIITRISQMDNDALSRFLRKEDLDRYKKATEILGEYQAKIKKINEEKSPILKDAEEKLDKKKRGKTEAEARRSSREKVKAEKQSILDKQGYVAALDKTRDLSKKTKEKRKEVLEAEETEKAAKNQLSLLQKAHNELKSKAEAMKANLSTQLAELDRTEKYYEQVKARYEKHGFDKSQNYQNHPSYQNAEKKYEAAKAQVEEYSLLEEQISQKEAEIANTRLTVDNAKKNTEEAKKQHKDTDSEFRKAQDEQANLEKQLKSTIEEWEEATKSLAEAEKEVRKYTQAVQEAEQALERVKGTEQESKQKQGDAAYETLKEEAASLGLELEQLDLQEGDTAGNADKLSKAIENFKSSLIDSIKVVQKADDVIDQAGEAHENMAEAAQESGEKIDAAQEAYTEMGKALEKNREKVEECHEAQEALNEETARIEGFEAKIRQFLGMAGAVETLKRALSSAFQTTKELDAAMAEMAVVTDLGVSDYWDQLPEHAERAEALGVAIHSVYEAETLYYQQGLKTNEVQALATETLKMARIAGLSAADATDKMTAALRGFNMELNEVNAQRVADVYSELAAITAADVKEISSAMSKTASIASSAGMEFETTAAFLSQIIETTRESAETAGTAMKTVIARFQELKKSPNEIGEVEGEIVDANAIETALRSVGVSLREANGQFRELDDVFIELSSKWSSLDKNTQRYIATIAAGSRQQSRFIAMMQDFGRTQELVAAANNSAGASQKQYEKTLESLETKLIRLKTAWEEFSMGILESNLVKAGVDILTTFLNIINKATDGFDGMAGSISKILSTIALFKIGQKVFDKLKGPMEGFFFDLAKKLYVEGEKGGKEYVGGFKKGSKEASQEDEKEKSDQQKDEPDQPKPDQSKKEPESFAKKYLGFDKEKYAATGKELSNKKDELKTMKDTPAGDIWTRGEQVRKEKQKLRQIKKDKGKESDEYKDQQKKVEEAEVALEKYREKQDEVGKAAKEQWAVVGQSVQQVGSAVTGLGIGISAIGGILDQLGLEGAGKLVTQIGNGVAIVGAGISFVGTMLSAIPPILAIISSHPIIAIIVAICALIVGTIAIIAKAKKDNSISARMEKAAKATEQAKEAAQQAKEEYQEIVDTKKGFDEMQESLKSLTKGTKEWKEALRESNEMVMQLIAKYPELAKYIQKTESGGLTIAEEGWDTMLANQQRAINNTQSAVSLSQQKELSLKEENLRGDFEQTSKVMRTDSEGNTIQDYEATMGLRNDLENLYLIQGSSLAEQESQVEAIAQKWDIMTDQVLEAGAELEKNQAELVSIGEQMESIARANLTVVASESVTNSEFGDEAVDAFANSLNSENFENAVNSQIVDLKETSDYENSEEFQRLAKEYNVSNDLTGNDTQNLKTLYAAVTGSEADSDMSREEMLTKIAKIDQTNKLVQNMEQYTATLENIAEGNEVNGVQGNAQDAKLIAGLLSDDGKGIDPDQAKKFIDENGTFVRSEVDEIANKYFGSIDAWAEKVGKTTEELYDEIEKNIRDSQKINLSTYQRLNKALGKANGEINKFGTNVSITTQNQKALAEQIISLSQIVDDKTALGVKAMLDQILDSAGDKADMVANILGSTNLNNLTDLEKLPELFKNLGVELDSTALESFIQKIKGLGVAIETVDIKKMASAIQNMYDLYASIMSGEQSRDFTQEGYETLVKSNSDLADKFVQVGDVFKYVGGSIGELAKAFALESVRQTEIAKQQLSSQLQVSTALNTFDAQGGTSFGGKNLQITDGDRNNWSKEEKIAYLEAFRSSALEEDSEINVETLRYVTGEDGNSLGLSLGANFQELSDEALDAAISGLGKLADSTLELSEDLDKVNKDSRISSLTLLDYSINYENSAGGTDKEAATAFGMQAASSGQVAESVIARYNELVAGAKEETSSELNTLREVMKKGLDRANESIKKLNALQDLNNRVAEALYNKKQAEIDKLSQINDSINDTNANILSKMQEQINEDRTQRELDRAAENIADKQARLAYLMRDSSGASALEAQALEEEIAADQEGYGDKLVDESLRQLQDANEKAAAQREQQIAIMQAQLDFSKASGELQREAEDKVKESIDDVNNGIDPLDTSLAGILEENEQLNGTLTPDQLATFQSGLSSEITNTANAYNALTQEKTTLDSIDSIANDISEWLRGRNGEGGVIEKEKTAAKNEIEKQNTRSTAVTDAVAALNNGGTVGTGSEYAKAKKDYLNAGGTEAQWVAEMNSSGAKIQTATGVLAKATGWKNKPAGSWDNGIEVKIGDQTFKNLMAWNPWGWKSKDGLSDTDISTEEMNSVLGLEGNPDVGSVTLYKNKPYILQNRRGKGYVWSELRTDTSTTATSLAEAMRKQYAFKTGGLADFTGPAWLDGTKTKPEIVLNQTDSANFLQLRDILADILDGTSVSDSNKNNNNKGGDNYYDIEISVESLSNDYDVEQLAKKVRSMLYEDASYRNVNAINFVH